MWLEQPTFEYQRLNAGDILEISGALSGLTCNMDEGYYKYRIIGAVISTTRGHHVELRHMQRDGLLLYLPEKCMTPQRAWEYSMTGVSQ